MPLLPFSRDSRCKFESVTQSNHAFLLVGVSKDNSSLRGYASRMQMSLTSHSREVDKFQIFLQNILQRSVPREFKVAKVFRVNGHTQW